MKRNLFGIMLLSGISILPKANAQTTYEEMEQLTVNEQITTVITASEPVRFVDISTDKVAGDQPIANIIRGHSPRKADTRMVKYSPSSPL